MSESIRDILDRVRNGDATVRDADTLEEVIFSLITDLMRAKHAPRDDYELAGLVARKLGYA